MTTPAYSHTYRYTRTGVGDIIDLGEDGAPFTLTVTDPGYTFAAFYATDRLATPQNTPAWTQIDLALETLPTTAKRILVNVGAVPSGQAPNSPPLEIVVSSTKYKSAAQHQDYASGRFDGSGLASTPKEFGLALRNSAEIRFVADSQYLWQDFGRTSQVTAAGQDVGFWDNIGTLSGFAGVGSSVDAEQALWDDDDASTGMARAVYSKGGASPTSELVGIPGQAVSGGQWSWFAIASSITSSSSKAFWYGDADADGFGHRWASATRLRTTRNNSSLELNAGTLYGMSAPYGYWFSGSQDSSEEHDYMLSGDTTIRHNVGVVAVDISNTGEFNIFTNPEGTSHFQIHWHEILVWLDSELTQSDMLELGNYARGQYAGGLALPLQL